MIKHWTGNQSSAKPKDRPDIIGATNLALMQFLMEIPNTPQALLVVVITTYSTWQLQTMYVPDFIEPRPKRAAAREQGRRRGRARIGELRGAGDFRLTSAKLDPWGV